MSIYSVPPLISASLFLVLGAFVFLKNTSSTTNRIFAWACMITFIWQFVWTILFSIKDPALADLLVKIGYSGIIFIPISFYHFTMAYLQEIREARLIFISYIIGIGFLISIWISRLFINGYHIYFWGFYPKAGFLHPFYLFLLFFLAIRGLKILIVKAKQLKNSPFSHNQIKYLFLSFLIYCFASFDFAVNYGLGIYPVGFIFIMISSAIMAYAIIKYRLMDITVFTIRGLIFSGVYFFILGIPFWLGYRLLGRGLWILPVSIAVVFATFGPFIYNYFRRRAEDIILKDQRRYQEALRQLSATLTLIKDLNRLLKLVVLRVARAVKVDFACVYLANENKLIQKYPYTIKGFFPDFPKELSFDSTLIRYISSKHKPIFAEELVSMTDGFNLRYGLIVPSFVRKRLLGFLVLGPKASGVIYTQEDANMFGILANQLALAIENSQFLDEHERTQVELFSKERMASLGTMAGGMTHQINNRFHAISMATSDTIDTFNFIDPNSCSQEAKDYLKQIKHALTRIQENVLRGGKLVNDFLNFSQPDRLQKEAKLFNLLEPLERGIEMVRIKTAFSQDTIQKEIPESPLLIRGSFVMIQDVYFNLTDNAIDALDKKDKAIKNKELTPPEEGYKGKVAIRMYTEDTWVVTKIQDNGIGMAKEQLEELFIPFFTTKATAVKGTGLGLFVIYKIIEAHDGTIQVESEYGKGTTFSIKLPLAKEEENHESRTF